MSTTLEQQFPALTDIRRATFDARKRTGLNIGTEAADGKLRVIRLVVRPGKVDEVIYLSEPLPLAEVAARLNAVQ